MLGRYRFLSLNQRFGAITDAIDEELHIANFPDKLRFGAASGVLYELPTSDGQTEYIGSCINLASRLTKYSHELSFVVSASLEIGIVEGMKERMQRYVATDVRSFPAQKVLCLTAEVEALAPEQRAKLFLGA